MKNQIEWHLAIKYMEANEEKMALWVWEEPRRDAELRREFKRMLSTPGIKEPAATYRRRIVNFFLNQFVIMKSQALTRCLKHTEASSAELLKGDPFSF